MNPNGKSSILLIYTGGTIGMVQDSASQTLKPFEFSGVLSEVPELGKFAYKIDHISFQPLIDSSDIEPEVWKKIASTIEDNYAKYDGFVVLHGTDTMAYSASVLSFMLKNLTKPVIFTGSQLPIGAPRTDGRENLVSSVEIAAAKDAEGHARVSEVCIFFGNKLYRGNRTSKTSSDDFNAFSSPNLPPLAEAGINIRFNDAILLKPTDWDAPLKVCKTLDTRVSILKIHPGITPRVVSEILCGEGTKAIIIETYGSGNAPSKGWFLEIVRKAASMGKILVNVTQCAAGKVNMGLYATGKALEDCSVIGGADGTTEGTLGKLFCLLGEYSDPSEIKEALSKSLRGEISL